MQSPIQLVPTPGQAWPGQLIQGGKPPEQLPEVKSGHHTSLYQIWLKALRVWQGTRHRRQAWGMKEGEFHSPSSHPPCLDCLSLFPDFQGNSSWSSLGGWGTICLGSGHALGTDRISHDRGLCPAPAGTEATPDHPEAPHGPPSPTAQPGEQFPSDGCLFLERPFLLSPLHLMSDFHLASCKQKHVFLAC